MAEISAQPIESITAAGGDVTVNMQSSVDQGGYTEQQFAMTERALEGAFSSALNIPGSNGKSGIENFDVANSRSGLVGNEKAKLVSDADTPLNGMTSAEATEARMASMTGRINTLYLEMTNWQVAWSIAQRIQQDTNHLLRGQ